MKKHELFFKISISTIILFGFSIILQGNIFSNITCDNEMINLKFTNLGYWDAHNVNISIFYSSDEASINNFSWNFSFNTIESLKSRSIQINLTDYAISLEWTSFSVFYKVNYELGELNTQNKFVRTSLNDAAKFSSDYYGNVSKDDTTNLVRFLISDPSVIIGVFLIIQFLLLAIIWTH